SPSRDLRPVLDENAPSPSAKTPTHLQASCGARNLRARFDERERVSSKGACDRRARTKSERRRRHAGLFLKLRLVTKLPPRFGSHSPFHAIAPKPPRVAEPGASPATCRV